MEGPGAGRKGAPPGVAAPWGSRRIGSGEGLRRREPGLGNQTWGGSPGLGNQTGGSNLEGGLEEEVIGAGVILYLGVLDSTGIVRKSMT